MICPYEQVFPARYPLMSDIRLIWDAADYCCDLAFVHVVVAPDSLPPFTVAAEVIEQDTARVLDEDMILLEPDESLGHLVREMVTEPMPAPGSVLASGAHPLQIQAIIHDLDKEPSWCEVGIREAWRGIVSCCEEHAIDTLALPLLGTRLRSMDRRQSVRLLRELILGSRPACLQRIWLRCPLGAQQQVLELLQGESGPAAC